MKYDTIGRCLDFELFRWVRDSSPAEAEVIDWLGYERQGIYHNLRKAGMLVLSDGRVELAPKHLSADGKCFWWENHQFVLDEDVINTFREETEPMVEGAP